MSIGVLIRGKIEHPHSVPATAETAPGRGPTSLEDVVPFEYSEALAARFWSKVDRNGPVPEHRPELGPCWVWTANRTNKGYGMFHVPNAPHRGGIATHVAWALADGDWQPDEFISLHACDNRACVRNDEQGIYVVRGVVRPRWGHIFLGTLEDNARDMVDKGRAGTGVFKPGIVYPQPSGEQCKSSKLTRAQALEVRARKWSGESASYLGREFGVDEATIRKIANGITWKELP